VQSLEKPSWGNGPGKESGPIFTTPMYEGLESNLPKSLMCYSDKPFSSESPLFIPREGVCQYLEEYAEDVKSLIQFETQVLDIGLRSIKPNPDVWTVKYQNLRSGTEMSAVYDAVAVCIGHYNVPYVPDIPGIREWNEAFPGRLSHSRYYRRLEDFTDKKVIVVGNSASGVDIATQISAVAKPPVLVSSRSESFLVSTGAGKEEVPEIVEFLPPSEAVCAVRFKDGRIEDGVDAVLFCTGYLYSYPFLPSLHPKLISNGFRVQNVYQHMFYIEHPSLAFVLLPFRIMPFPMSEAEAGVIARVWSGRLQLPAPEAMYRWEDDRINNKGVGTSFHALNFPEDLDHHNNLHDWAAQTDKGLGKMAHKWNEKERWTRQRFPAIKKAFADRGELRHEVRTIEELGFDYEAWLRAEEEGRMVDPKHAS